MANLTTKQRDALPASEFGDPGGRRFPITDQDDVDSAAHLLGKASNPDAVKKRIIAIAKRKGLKIPDAWQTAAMSASFAVDDQARAPDGMVYRSGLIFRAGNYADQEMDVTETDIADIVAAFSDPLDAELEHFNSEGRKTFLDGHLGQLVKVWANGAELHGQLLIPAWMDPLWEKFGRKVSIVLNRATKQLRRIGLVLDPQIEDAAVMSKTVYAAFAAAHPATEVDDLAAVARFLGNRHSKADLAAIQQIHDISSSQGATCTPVSMSSTRTGGNTSMASKLGHWFGLSRETRDMARDAGAELPEESTFSLLEDEAAKAREQAHKDEIAKFEAKQAEADLAVKAAQDALFAANAQRLQGEAAAFVDGLIVGNKVFPAEREAVIALYAQAGMDDATSGAVTFSNGEKGSRVAQLKASYEARPAHGLTKEQMAGNAPFSVVAGGKPEDKGPDSYSDEKLLSMTPAGRDAIKRKKQA